MRNLLWAALVAGGLCGAGEAQADISHAGTVRGVVTSAESGLPLVAAELKLLAPHLKGGSVSLLSSIDGSFVFERLSEGEYALEVDVPGREAVRLENVRIVDGRVVSRHLTLERAPELRR